MFYCVKYMNKRGLEFNSRPLSLYLFYKKLCHINSKIKEGFKTLLNYLYKLSNANISVCPTLEI